MAPRKLGMRIKRLRVAKGLTQEQLAKKVGVSRVHVANLESTDRAAHHRTPSLATLEKLAKALGVPVTALLEG
jgi:transcriptional regulator with XRE-family HTH domain